MGTRKRPLIYIDFPVIDETKLIRALNIGMGCGFVDVVGKALSESLSVL